MANHMRFRKADAKRLRYFAVNSATVIEIGDLLYQEVDDIRPASDATYGASLAITQANFAKQFKGVAMSASQSGETEPVLVATEGDFEFDCASATFEIGDMVGADDNAGGTALTDQQVIGMGEEALSAIGFVTKRVSAAATTVEISIKPAGEIFYPPQILTMYEGDLSTAMNLVTAWPVTFPFKLLEVRVIATVALTAANAILTITKNAQALDDTLTVVQSTSAIGFVTSASMVDATGDDIFVAGDTLTIASDGGSTLGSGVVQIVIAPFRSES